LTYSLIGTQVLIPLSSNVTTLIGLEDMTDLFEYQFSFVVAALMALPVSWFPTLQIYHRNTYQEKRLPGMQRWIVVPMIFAFILNTWGYLGWLVRLLILIVLANIYRGLWWRYRKEANTDREYRRYKGGFLIVMDLQPLTVIYRMMMVWILPIAFLLLSIAEILVTTKVLSGFGKTIEEWLNDFFGGKLSDVSAYAMDPSFALRIRSAVEYDLKFFHQMGLVDNIHVFAHSQGTPITFETLFTHMPKEYRKKIKTYVTIGSVLGYYYQVAPVLEEVYSPERFRKADYELDTFAEGFRWFNCWNLLDNITGFYGLDEYDLELMEENKNKRATEARYPTNIKTRTRGHSDYWTNLDEVQVPFARRVLYDKVDEKWKPTIRVKGPIQRIGAFLTWLCSLGLAGGTYAIIASLASRTRNWPQIWDGIGGAFGALFKALAKIEFLKTMFDFDTVALLFMDREKFKETWFFAQLNETPVYGWLNDILGWILGNLGGILGGIIAFYIGVQIVKVVCFLQRSKES
jgi:pimeloyl-ACP methyl ester carboxylesterase